MLNPLRPSVRNARQNPGPPTHIISNDIHQKMAKAINSAWATSTLGKYSNSVHLFLKFCTSQGIAHNYCLPASEFLLCAFAASSIGIHAGTTARGNLSAIRAWHIANNFPYAGQNSLRLSYTLKGVENARPGSSHKPVRPPVTRNLLNYLSQDLDLSNPLDAAVYGCATSATWGQARLGELLSETQSSFDPSFTPTVSNLLPSSTPAGSRMLHLPNTKTTGKKGANIMICRQYVGADPIEALENHLRVNKIPQDLPLFSYHTHSGIICLTKKKFLHRCNSIWRNHSLPSITGHSFRIGGTTELLICGVHPDVVKMMGRWSSDAFLSYWRSLEIVAPLHTEYLPPNTLVSSHHT